MGSSLHWGPQKWGCKIYPSQNNVGWINVENGSIRNSTSALYV